MTITDLFRLLTRHALLIILVSLLAATIVFFATKNTKKEYTSHTLINTGLVSGYSLESSKGGRVDYAYTNNELQNLISIATSYETQEDLATELLVQYLMLEQPDSLMILAENFNLLEKEAFKDSFWKEVIISNSYEETLDNVLRYRDQSNENPVNELIYSGHDYFGVEQLATLEITRERNSDLIRFKYTTTDPGVCRQTLVTLTNIFIQKQKNIKSGQSTDVLDFFKKATDESAAVLRGKEDDLLQFMVRNKIINYYEQTRYISAGKEKLDELFFKEKMNLAAADSALHRVQSELKNRFEMPNLNQNMLAKQKEIMAVSSKMARYESLLEDSLQATSPELLLLTQRMKELKSDMRTNAEATFAVQRTPGGTEMKDLLFQWLNQLIESEQSSARLQVFMERKKEFMATYQKFAPWGSKLKRFEREIDVAERAYLENLHSYNQARLHQHSMMMATNLKVMDTPFLPTKPKSGKRGLLIILAFMGGFVLSSGSLVALELVDATLKSPTQASEIIGVDLFGAFPFFPKNWKNKEQINYDETRKRSFGQLYQNIKLGLHNLPTKSTPRRITFFSTREEEGKSFMAQEMAELLRSAGEKVLYLCPDTDHMSFRQAGGGADNYFYPIDHSFLKRNRSKI